MSSRWFGAVRCVNACVPKKTRRRVGMRANKTNNTSLKKDILRAPPQCNPSSNAPFKRSRRRCAISQRSLCDNLRSMRTKMGSVHPIQTATRPMEHTTEKGCEFEIYNLIKPIICTTFRSNLSTISATTGRIQFPMHISDARLIYDDGLAVAHCANNVSLIRAALSLRGVFGKNIYIAACITPKNVCEMCVCL